MILLILATIAAVAVSYRVTSVGKGLIVSERRRPSQKLDPVQQAPLKVDPFAHHPMHCKCTFHR